MLILMAGFLVHFKWNIQRFINMKMRWFSNQAKTLLFVAFRLVIIKLQFISIITSFFFYWLCLTLKVLIGFIRFGVATFIKIGIKTIYKAPSVLPPFLNRHVYFFNFCFWSALFLFLSTDSILNRCLNNRDWKEKKESQN